MPASPPSPLLPLSTLMTPEPLGDGVFSLNVPDGWQQGRGAFGGYLLGALVRAVEAVVGPERALRSLTAELPGPTLPGPTDLRVALLREGTHLSTFTAQLFQRERVTVHAVAVMGSARSPVLDRVSLEMPSVPRWRDVEPFPADLPIGPAFAKHWEFRNIGPLPTSSTPEAVTTGWIRPRSSGPRDMAWLVACADAWWPALVVSDDTFRPMATVSFTFEPVTPLDGLDPEAPVLCVARTLAAREGYAVELRELWSDTGALLALNHQTSVVLS